MYPGVKTQALLGRYELLARLATGGMGEIFLSRLEGAAGFEKLYVVKRILPHLADDVRFRQMLISEAQIAAKMSHANICQVYELGEIQGQLFIAMEYLEGVTMLPLLRRASKAQTPLDFGFVAGVIQQVCDALHYAHELKDRNGESLGLIHRDVTPSNVFVTESGVVKILDFGIAKAKGASSSKTEDGAVKGKYAYMAPEQLRGGQLDRRADVFAVGVVLYEMLALRRLFQRKTDYLTFRAVMEQPIADIRRYRPDIPDALASVVACALDRDPTKRYQTARQLATAVLDAVSSVKIRPWTQGEISDLVRANFGADLAKRSQQVADAVNRRSGPAPQRASMPLIAHDDGGPEGDDDGIPPAAGDGEPLRPSPSQNAEPFTNGGTPPPFAEQGERTSSAPSLQPLGPAPITAVIAHRSWVWPMLAMAMVMVAGGALFLVWKQVQDQPKHPAVINLTQEVLPTPLPPVRDGAEVVDSGTAPSDSAATTVVADDPIPGKILDPKPKARTASSKKYSTYDQALAAQKPAMVRCLMDYRDGGIPKEAITAVIQIAASGHAKSVQLKPEAVNVAPLGGCLRNVLMGGLFPKTPTDNTITVPLKPKAT